MRVLSTELERIIFENINNSAEWTESWCPRITVRQRRLNEISFQKWIYIRKFIYLFKSHNRTVLSWDADAIKSPHEWKLTDQTKSKEKNEKKISRWRYVLPGKRWLVNVWTHFFCEKSQILIVVSPEHVAILLPVGWKSTPDL